MCITFLFTNSSDSSFKYKLVLINNRDEFYSRKTLKAQLKSENNFYQIFGTDVETKVHGTWLAISKRGDTIRVANLLNLPGEDGPGTRPKDELKGRGPIALDFIQSNEDIKSHNQRLCDDSASYNSFNFLSVEIKSNDIKTFFASSKCQKYVDLETGFYGFSNSPVNSPLQKVIAGREKFSAVIKEHGESETLIDALKDLLQSDDKHYPDDELLRRRGHDAEDFSSIHVRVNQFYGTRTRTIILIDQDDNIEYIEDTMANQDPENPTWETTRIKVNSDGTYEE